MLRIDGAQFTNTEIQNDFRNFLFDLAKQNQKTEQIKKVKCFVVLFYDEKHPYLRKVLRDKDFWESLDKLTQERLAVIAYAEHEFKSPPPMMGLMLNSLAERASSIEETSVILEKALNIEIPRGSLPCLLVFAWNKDSSDANLGQIKVKSIEEAYEVLETLVGGLGTELMEYEERDLTESFAIVTLATDYLKRKIDGIVWRQRLKGKGWLITLAKLLTNLHF